MVSHPHNSRPLPVKTNATTTHNDAKWMTPHRDAGSHPPYASGETIDPHATASAVVFITDTVDSTPAAANSPTPTEATIDPRWDVRPVVPGPCVERWRSG